MSYGLRIVGYIRPVEMEGTQSWRRHPWFETHVPLSRYRLRGARTKEGTCSTCSLSTRSTLSPLSIGRFMNATGYTELIESQCEISGCRLLSLSARNRGSNATPQASRHHRAYTCSPFISSPLFFLYFLLYSSFPRGHGTASQRKGEKKRTWNGEGSMFASKGTVAWDLFTCP